MTFEARELSAELGAPIMLATFALGAKTWRFARAEAAVTHGGNLYLPTSMKGSRIRQSADAPRNEVALTVPRDFPIAELWRTSPPTGTVAAILTDIHEDEAEGLPAWLGHVAGVKWMDGAKAEVRLSPGVMAMRSMGLRRLWQRPCPHVLYGPGCNLDRELFRDPAVLTSNVGVTMKAAAFALRADGLYNGGFIEWTDADGVTDWRFIVGHVGDTLTLMTPAPTLVAGSAVDAFQGCSRIIERCEELGNTPNFGGIPYFTRKNPFDGNPVY